MYAREHKKKGYAELHVNIFFAQVMKTFHLQPLYCAFDTFLQVKKINIELK